MDIVSELTTKNSLTVIVGLALLGLCCGGVGTFTVLRGRSLVSDALAHAALPGVCVAYLITGERDFVPLFLGAICAGLVSVWLLNTICQHSRIKQDAAIAVVLSVMFGLGISLSRMIQNTSRGNQAGLDDFIFGNAATLLTSDAVAIGIIATVTLAIITALRKEIALICFDREFAHTIGRPVRHIDSLLTLCICACTAVALPAVGAILVAALLIFPASTARLWTTRVTTMMLLSSLIGLIAAAGGTVVGIIAPHLLGATALALPTGPTIVLFCALLFLLSYLLAPTLRSLRGGDR